jgi:hypothetical protein
LHPIGNKLLRVLLQQITQHHPQGHIQFLTINTYLLLNYLSFLYPFHYHLHLIPKI